MPAMLNTLLSRLVAICGAAVSANTSSALEYSDILLATATAQWETNARSEIDDFTDSLNAIGNGYGYSFGKDFVLKACLYLSENLPIQYKVKNFTKTNFVLSKGIGKRSRSRYRQPCG